MYKSLIVLSFILILSSLLFAGEPGNEKKTKTAKNPKTENAGEAGVSFVNSNGDTLLKVQENGKVVADTILADSISVNGTAKAAFFEGDGSRLTNLPAGAAGWGLTGNSGTDTTVNFIGTIDNMSLDFRVNNLRGLRLSPGGLNTPNIVGGSAVNTISSSAYGSVIAGGGAISFPNSISNTYAAIGGGLGNMISESEGTIGGGRGNSVTGARGTVSGGWNNTAASTYATVGGGTSNNASGISATIAGGNTNVATGESATIGGGGGNPGGINLSNTAGGNYATIPGGAANMADGAYSFAAGFAASVQNGHDGAILFADGEGLNQNTGGIIRFYSETSNEFAARASGGVRFVTGVDGSGNPSAGVKLAAGDSVWTTLNGTPIGGGVGWGLAGNSGTDTTINFIGTTDDMGLYFRVNNRQALRLISNGTGTPHIIGGHEDNTISSGFQGSIIAGGGANTYQNTITGNYSTISGGWDNNISAALATIGGGENNTVTGVVGTVSGGRFNFVTETSATVAGGTENTASGIQATVAGGRSNTASGRSAAVGGGGDAGRGNTASGDFATIPGGRDNTAAGDYSFAIGHGANNTHNGAMLFADDQGTGAGNGDAIQFNSEATNEFAARASGGVRFITGVDGSGNPTAGVKLAAGDSVWTTLNGNPVGGAGWDLTGNSGTDTTVNFIGTTDNMPLDFRVNSNRAIRIAPGGPSGTQTPNIILGDNSNAISVSQSGSAIGGGASNRIMGSSGFIGGGDNNAINGGFSGTIGGGDGNSVSGSGATISGGIANSASGSNTTVSGGSNNTASALNATIAGGNGNTASGQFAAIPGGRDNTAAGDYSVAAGYGANSTHNGAILFADDQGAGIGGSAIPFNSEAANEFAARAAGGVRFVTGVDGSGNPTAGVKLAAGDSVWTTLAGDTLGAGDDLGNHIATQNINLSGNYLSGDGDAEGIFVDTDGKVGIGVSAPNSKLVVRDASRAALSLKSDDNTDFTGLAFENSAGSYTWSIHRAPNPGTAADLVFAGGNTNGDPAALNERMRIAKNGDVGIGTDIPASKLDVNGTVSATAFVGDGSGLTGVSGDDLGNHRATQNIRLDGNYLSGDGGNEGIYVANNGDVGFGTNSPGSLLEVFDDTSPRTMLHLNNQVNVGATVIQKIGPYLKVSGGTIADAAKSAIGLEVDISGINGDSVYAAILEGGNVGIGTHSPSSPLEVNGSFATKVTTTATNLTLDDSHSIVLCNGSNITITLPSASGISGRQYTIKTISTNGATTISTQAGELIEGIASSVPLPFPRFIKIVSDGANWWVIGSNTQ